MYKIIKQKKIVDDIGEKINKGGLQKGVDHLLSFLA
jgi:hypothetical protein